MNQAARTALPAAATVLDALRRNPGHGLQACFPLGSGWLWLSHYRQDNARLLESVQRISRALWEVSCRRGTRNVHLCQAEGRLDRHQTRISRERLRRRAGAEYVRAVEAERGRIARELHDNAGQSLAAILLNLELVERQMGASSSEVQARLRRSRDLASLTLDQVRRISHDLHPPEWKDQDFPQAVEWLLNNMGIRDRLTVDPVVLDIPRELDPSIQTVLYRTLQEGLTNIMRHTAATRVSIEATSGAYGVRLLLEDDGPGFDPGSPVARPGIGLANIRRRLESVGGHLHVGSAPGEGVRLSVFIPAVRAPRRQA